MAIKPVTRQGLRQTKARKKKSCLLILSSNFTVVEYHIAVSNPFHFHLARVAKFCPTVFTFLLGKIVTWCSWKQGSHNEGRSDCYSRCPHVLIVAPAIKCLEAHMPSKRYWCQKCFRLPESACTQGNSTRACHNVVVGHFKVFV